MATYHVRVARPEDREGVEALLKRSYPPLLAAGYDAELLAAALPAMIRANPQLLACGTWFVALDEHGMVAGCGGWTAQRPGLGEIEPGVGHLRHFGTHVDHLRRGVGRQLMERSFTTARAAGIERLDCDATLVAERFYQSLGLRTVEATRVTIPVLDRPGEVVAFPSLLMRIEL
jgi:N-acetylglutamate synthase-like GNAT family acetyltransferase